MPNINVSPHAETWYTYQGKPLEYKARWLDSAGSLLQQADVSAITYRVYDTHTGQQSATGTPVVSASVYDTAQTDSDWPYDSGFNLKFTLPGTSFPSGNRLYQVEVLLTLADGNTAADTIQVHARNLYSEG